MNEAEMTDKHYSTDDAYDDAARYRWLKEVFAGQLMVLVTGEPGDPNDLDEVIDAALAPLGSLEEET